MYFVIETEEQLNKLVKPEKCFIDLVSLSEETHPALTSPCILYYNDFEKGYIIPINHSEGFSVDLKIVQGFLKDIPKVYLLDKKWHSYFIDLPQTVDVYFTILDVEGVIKDFQCYTNVHLDFNNKFKYSIEANTLIPISKHYEKCECMFEGIKPYIGKENNLKWQNKYVEVYKWVEEQGLAVDERVFDKFFEPVWKGRSVKESRIYTSYKLYNITSRPTNAFNGINFLALNKENGARAAFIPQNDVFVEFDFDGYHIRLIANMLGIEIPTNDSIHTVLGRMYFGKEELTSEEYQESKKITFRQLYNGIEDQYRELELFREVAEFIDAMWSEFKRTKRLILPNGRKLTGKEFTPQKLFNYYVQCLETVNNIKKLIALKQLLKDKKSKVVLVVYDSILIDYSTEDNKGLLKQIKEVLEAGGYRVKAQKGSNYDFFSN